MKFTIASLQDFVLCPCAAESNVCSGAILLNDGFPVSVYRSASSSTVGLRGGDLGGQRGTVTSKAVGGGDRAAYASPK